MNIERIPISEIKPHPKNPNRHSKEQIKRLAELIQYQGWRLPIIVSKQSGHVVSGHGRIEAAKYLKMSSVPIVYQDFVSDEQEYAFLVSDNAVAAWAELDLASINAYVPELGPDFNIDLLGLEDFTIEIADKIEPKCDEDHVPEHVEPKTKIGDLYQLGRHRLLCGDSTSIDAVEKLMAGEKSDMVFTSPPYNAGKPVRTGKDQKADSFYQTYEDDKDQSAYADFLSGFMNACMPFSRYQFVNLQMLAGNKVALIDWLNKYRTHLSDCGIWDKGHAQPSAAARVLNSRFEFIFIFCSEENPNRAIQICDFHGNIDNVYTAKRGEKNEFAKIHGATFPVHLPEHWINITNAKSVLEPFGGSGSTLIACEKTNRRCFMMEIDPLYCDIIIKRWETYTGKTAELLNGPT